MTKHKNDGRELLPTLKDYVLLEYFGSRKSRLKALNELIILYVNSITNNKVLPNDINQIIAKTVEGLFKKNLILNLCTFIKEAINLAEKDQTYWKEYQQEIIDVIGIFYTITNRILLKSKEIESMFLTLRVIIFYKSFKDFPKLQKACYMLALSLFPALLYNDTTFLYVIFFILEYINIYIYI